MFWVVMWFQYSLIPVCIQTAVVSETNLAPALFIWCRTCKRDGVEGLLCNGFNFRYRTFIDYFPSRRWRRSWRLSADRKTENRDRFLFLVLFWLFCLWGHCLVRSLGWLLRKCKFYDTFIQLYPGIQMSFHLFWT